MPWEVLNLYNYRIYLDNASECLIAFKEYISTPPRYIIHTPVLFNEWIKWAKEMIEQINSMNRRNEKPAFIKPLGEKICPPWVRYDFDNLEDFYKHYKSLTVEE